MDSNRTQYPALLDSLQPTQAVAVLDERVRNIGKLNTEIADWLTERRRVEELYVDGLRKLARRALPDASSDLGIFTVAWKTIVNSCDNLATSHHTLAKKIETDVEKPLRSFVMSNREMQAMSNMEGNLASLAKELDNARKKAEKLGDRGGKADSSKVASATSEVESANSQWVSQAPYVFEALQAADESRCNHLRDALTQYQTHEVDLVERNRATAEHSLNALLNVNTADEITAFSRRNAGGARNQAERVERPVRPERTSSRNTSSLAPPPMSSPGPDDRASQRSGSVQEEKQKKGGLSSLKRLGTVLSRRRQSTQPQTGSPSTGSRNTPTASTPTRNTPTASSRFRSPSPGFLPPSTIRESESAYEAPPGPSPSNGLSRGLSSDEIYASHTNTSLVSGSGQSGAGQLQEPLQPELPSSSAVSVGSPIAQQFMNTQRDAEGFSVPPPSRDPISQALYEADSYADPSASQLKLDIRNAPIAEEGPETETAMANMQMQLRAQAVPAQRAGTVRGRRDVRNTVYIPSPGTLDTSTEQQSFQPSIPSGSGLATTSFSPQTSTTSGIMMTPFLQQIQSNIGTPQRTNTYSDLTESDSRSIRSSTSVSTNQNVKHPDMNQQGLGSSVVETMSAWLDHGQVTRAVVIGELALSYNPGIFPSSSNAENIRLENFAALEKVAPNPALISQTGRPGDYTVNLSAIFRTAVAFKYQVHIDDVTLARQAPIILTPSWRVEPTQTSVILHYSLNPAFTSPYQQPITLTNVALAISLETGPSGTGKPTTCLSKPAGTFSKERAAIYWRLNDVTLAPGAPPEKILARFQTDGQAAPGRVEAKWEITGHGTEGLGSGLSVTRAEESGLGGESDPFADEEVASPEGRIWRAVDGVRRLVSGTYTAV